MNNDRKGLEKIRKKELWRDQREPNESMTKKRFEVTKKDYHRLERITIKLTKSSRQMKKTTSDR